MIVWSICVSISVTITHIWTKFGTEHKYHTVNTPEWPHSHKLKIEDGGGRHLEFRRNVNYFGLDKDILHQIRLGRCITTTRRWLPDQKSKPEVNSHDVIWSIRVSISVTITYILTKFSIEQTNLNKSGLDKDICTKFHGKMHHGHAGMTSWPKVKSGS